MENNWKKRNFILNKREQSIANTINLCTVISIKHKVPSYKKSELKFRSIVTTWKHSMHDAIELNVRRVKRSEWTDTWLSTFVQTHPRKASRSRRCCGITRITQKPDKKEEKEGKERGRTREKGGITAFEWHEYEQKGKRGSSAGIRRH